MGPLMTMLASAGIATMAIAGTLPGAFFRLECHGKPFIGRVDPIVSPGRASQHVHAILGGSGISHHATYDDLISSNCTSCSARQDKSAYWTPTLYFQDANGDMEMVPFVALNVYYLGRGPNVTAWPEGFRMIAGDSNRRNWTIEHDVDQSHWREANETTQDALAQHAIGFNCMQIGNGMVEGTFTHHRMRTKEELKNCPAGLRLEVAFPSCWNGKDLDSPDHKAHVAYPDLVQDGNCPEGFETRLPTIFYETTWDTPRYNDREGRFVLSNGDTTGYGYHGDFMMGWISREFLQQVLDTCKDDSGVQAACALINPPEAPLLTPEEQQLCMAKTPEDLVDENVLGGSQQPLKALPGNVQIYTSPDTPEIGGGGNPIPVSSAEVYGQTGGGDAQQPSSTQPAASQVPTSQVPTSQVPTSQVPTSQERPTATVPMTTTIMPTVPSATIITPAPTVTPTGEAGVVYEPVRTEYVTKGSQVLEIVYVEPVVYVVEDVVTTATVTLGANGKAERRHLAHHQHHARGH